MQTKSVHNTHEYSVSELARAIKKSLETEFGQIRIKGEISRPNYHSSGHLYFTLKDEEAVIDAVCWRSSLGKLSIHVEEGMEVICFGRVSSYARSSKYQFVVESIELAGEGALLKLLDDRRKKLSAEGIFDSKLKKEIPFLPDVIGVITSPSGAVIKDILHRISDRFPRPVFIWPVPVQGKTAAERIAEAIIGFNKLPEGGSIPRPATLIIARGGGSLEDLWCFNEEVVVRAVAESKIPIISAVGHETDTTLIDYVADLRAPTPTAAAEMAVPVRSELSMQTLDNSRRLIVCMERYQTEKYSKLDGLGRGLPRPDMLIAEAVQRLDGESERLAIAVTTLRTRLIEKTKALGLRIRNPQEVLLTTRDKLGRYSKNLDLAGRFILKSCQQRVDGLEAGIRIKSALIRCLASAGERIHSYDKLLESYSYKNTLARGFSLIRDFEFQPVKHAAQLKAGELVHIEFSDGQKSAVIRDEKKELSHVGKKRIKNNEPQKSKQETLL